MSMCRVFSCVVGRGCLLWPVHFLGNTLLSLCPASFRIPRPNLPVTPGVSWLPTFAFQSPIMKRTSFWGISSQRSCRSSQNLSTSAFSALLVWAQTWITVVLNGLPWKWTEIILSFLRLHPSTAFWRRRRWHPTPVLLPGESHGWRILVGCNPWGRKESDITEQLPFQFSLSCIGEGNGNPLQCSCL